MKVNSNFKFLIFFFLFIGFNFSSYANDGAYYMSGNHLIPMIETKITVKKEILSIRKVNPNHISVSVYYEFFNPENERILDVGFEAESPFGDANGIPINGKHPYMYEFTVNMNSEILPYQVAIVNDSIYYKNGQFVKLTEKEIQGQINDDEDGVTFNYAYHFKAKFKKGTNSIVHTYLFKVSGSVDLLYDFKYVLTAANRWGNKQIDDFTLIIDMGDFQDFNVSNTFFNSPMDWTIVGKGIKIHKPIDKLNYENNEVTTKFYIQTGSIVFQKMNFKPSGELNLYSRRGYFGDEDQFDSKTMALPFNHEVIYTLAADELSLRILKNLPYARRGYVFKNADLQKYFESMPWYLADPSYEADLSLISDKEQEWLKSVK